MPNSYDDKLLNGAGLSYFWGIVKGYLDAKPGEIVIQNGAVKGEVFNNGANAAADQNTATGVAAHAEGKKTVSSNIATHAEGQNTTASGTYGAHAEGDGCTASGSNGSHAEGKATVASGFAAHAEGGYTEAKSAYQHVQGKYNTIDSSAKYAFIIGNGTGSATNKRSNAFCIDWDGKIYVNNEATGIDVRDLARVIDIYGRGTAIASGDSLNNYTTVGVYYCSSTNCNSVTPRPESISATAFKLVVSEINTTDGTRIIQDIFPVNSDTTEHYRRNKGNNYSETSGWRPWVKMITDVDLTTGLATKQNTLQFDTHATASSSNMLTSGTVFSELYNIPANLLPSGTDFDDLMQPGVYYCSNLAADGSQASTMVHTPYTGGGFKLEVLHTWNSSRPLQRLWIGGARFYMRGHNGSKWLSWYEYGGTEVTS